MGKPCFRRSYYKTCKFSRLLCGLGLLPLVHVLPRGPKPDAFRAQHRNQCPWSDGAPSRRGWIGSASMKKEPLIFWIHLEKYIKMDLGYYINQLKREPNGTNLDQTLPEYLLKSSHMASNGAEITCSANPPKKTTPLEFLYSSINTPAKCQSFRDTPQVHRGEQNPPELGLQRQLRNPLAWRSAKKHKKSSSKFHRFRYYSQCLQCKATSLRTQRSEAAICIQCPNQKQESQGLHQTNSVWGLHEVEVHHVLPATERLRETRDDWDDL